MGDKPAVLLRGNGQVTVGRTIPEAVMMAIYLEEAAEILYGALQIGTPIPLDLDESKQRQIEALPPVDMERAWNFFKNQSRAAKTQISSLRNAEKERGTREPMPRFLSIDSKKLFAGDFEVYFRVFLRFDRNLLGALAELFVPTSTV